ncbi:MAG: DUF308 domain-containing protein [Clostridiales bacterium]|nr:DUF308 domain-containing protein [Clostridiales bacterium]
MDVFMDYWLEIVIFAAGIFEIYKFFKNRINKDRIDLYAGLSLVVGVLYILLGVYFLTPLSEKRDRLTMILGIIWAASIVARWIYGKNKNAA